jgi:hypothetical protein
MSTRFRVKRSVLAVAAVLLSPTAFAQGVTTTVTNTNTGTMTYANNVSVSLTRRDDLTGRISLNGDPTLRGVIDINGASEALVDTKQESVRNTVSNNIVNNSATVNGGSLNSASGNIGVNVAAGDNNAQSNDGALTAADAAFVFASAQSFGFQQAANNGTANFGVDNSASLSGALIGVRGNVGVNVAAGNNNVQANALAASVGFGTQLAKASSYTNQVAAGNTTSNAGASTPQAVTQTITLTGRYAGIVDQYRNIFPDTWGGFSADDITNNGNHSCCVRTGHIDLDNGVQSSGPAPVGSATDRPQASGLLANGNPNSDLSTTGALTFNEAGDLRLSGTISTLLPVFRPHVNNASLSGGALGGAQGNIGVNIAAGTNNLQRNSLAIAVGLGRPGVTTPPPGGGGGGGGG